MKSKSSQYYLQQIEDGNEITIRESSDKKLIFDLYDLLNEKNKNCTYQVVCQETISEVIAKSSDVRQTTFPF